MAAVESVKSVGARAVETVGEHPVPAALIGVGLAWLLLENSGIRPRQVRVLQRSRDAMSGVGQTVTEAAGTAGHAIVQAVGAAADTLVQGASAAGEYVSEATSAAREATSNGYETIGSFWERHPLAMSAAVLSAGIAAGMLLPVTARESSLMGDTATNVVRKVRRKGSELVEEGRRLATTGVKAAAREGLRQGITGGEIVHKMKRIARSARKAVTA